MAKGGTSSSNTQIPAYLEDAVRENINRARDVSQIGYTPYYGADVAAFSPMQQQSMRSTGNAASAFGLAPQGFDATAGIPQAQTFAGGVQGYSSAPLYEQSLDNLFANAPAQYNAINNMFIDPFTGARARNGGYGYASPVNGMARSDGGGDGGYVAPSSSPNYTPASDGGTGYWSGGKLSGMQTQNLSDPEFEAYVLAHGLPSDTYTDGDAVRGIAGNLLDSSLFGSVYERFTGDPLSGGSPNAIVSDIGTQARAIDGGLNPNGGLLGSVTTTPLASANITGSSYDQYAQSRIAVQEAQRQQLAQARQEADIQKLLDQEDAFNAQQAGAQNYANKQAAAAQRMANDQANQLAHDQKMAALSPNVAALRSSVNDGPQWSPSVNNSDKGAPQASYSNTGHNGYNFGL